LRLPDPRPLLLKVEPWIAGFYLAYFLGLDVPPAFISVMKASSYGVLILLLAGCWKRVLFAATRDIPLLLLTIMGVVSVIWSAAPEVTGEESKALVRGLIFGIYLAVRFGLKGLMGMLFGIFSIATVLSLLVAVALPSYGVHMTGEFAGAWKGIFLFKNLFAAHMVLATILFVIMALSRQKPTWIAWGLIPISVLLLVLSRGRTAMAVAVISLYVMPFYNFFKYRYKTLMVLIISMLLVGFGVLVLSLANIEFLVVDLLGKNLEFNGRLPIWTLMLEEGTKRLWLGHGFNGFWTSDSAHYVLTHTWAVSTVQGGARFNAHNGYIDLFLASGVVGVSLYAMSFITVFLKTLYLLVRTQQVEIFWVLQSLIFFALVNCADSLGVEGPNGLGAVYVAFAASIGLEYHSIRQDDKFRRLVGQPDSLSVST
jgi:exopolysaccharide production protein ExoQ